MIKKINDLQNQELNAQKETDLVIQIKHALGITRLVCQLRKQKQVNLETQQHSVEQAHTCAQSNHLSIHLCAKIFCDFVLDTSIQPSVGRDPTDEHQLIRGKHI